MDTVDEMVVLWNMANESGDVFYEERRVSDDNLQDEEGGMVR